MKPSFLSHSQKQTKNFAKNLARQILLNYKGQNFVKKNALVLGLEGKLGAGKTTFVQGFAKGLGIKEKVLSPTFVILKKFEIRNPKSETNSKYKFQNFYHVDCYRLEKPKELLQLGWQEIISNPQNIVLVEWADRIKSIFPKDAPWITFESVGGMNRGLTLKHRELLLTGCFIFDTLLS